MVQGKGLFINIKNGNLHRLDSTPLKHTHDYNLMYFIFLPACSMGWGKTVTEKEVRLVQVWAVVKAQLGGGRERIRLSAMTEAPQAAPICEVTCCAPQSSSLN